MAQGSTARRPLGYQVAYLRRTITADDANAYGLTAVFKVGTVPAGSLIVRSYICVREAFNAQTNNLIDLGTAADPDAFATDISLASVAIVQADETPGADNFPEADTDLVAQLQLTGNPPSTGIVDVVYEYIPPDEVEN